MILILFYRTQKSLLRSRLILIALLPWIFSYYVVPVTTKHSMGFSTACLSVGENSNVVARTTFLEDGLYKVKELSLSGGGSEDFFEYLFPDMAWKIDFKGFLC